MNVLHQLMSNITIYTVRHGVPVLYCRVYISPKNPVIDLRHIRNPRVRLVFDRRLLRKLLDGLVFIIGPKKNYRITMSGCQVQEFWLS